MRPAISIPLTSCLLACMSLLGCAATSATPEQQLAAERRLLAPFLRETEVGCSELTVELTGNFHKNVGQPAIDTRVHLARKEQGDGFVDTVWTNRIGDPKTSFVVTIGEAGELTEPGTGSRPHTRFTVVNQVRVRVFEGRHPLTLTARAGGDFAVVREASVNKPRDVTEFVVEDGVLKTR